MKKHAAAALLILFLADVSASSQTIEKIGVRAQLVSPKASVAETQKQGYGASVWTLLSLGASQVKLSAAVDFVSFPGDHKWILGQKIEYDSRYVVTVAVGPFVGNTKGAYLVPALSVSFGSLYSRPDFKQNGLPVGLDFSLGTRVPFGNRLMFDLGARLAMTNFFTESIPEATWGEGLDLERLSNMICLYMGLNF